MAECEIRIEEVMREGTAAERRLCGGEEGEREGRGLTIQIRRALIYWRHGIHLLWREID